jgi:nitroreductase
MPIKSLFRVSQKIPFINKFIWKLYYSFKRNKHSIANEESFTSTLALVAHGIDHRLLCGDKVPAYLLRRLDALYSIMKTRGYSVNDRILWASSIYTLAQQGLQQNYLEQPEAQSDSIHLNKKEDEEGGGALLTQCVRGRRSIRRWNETLVSNETIEEIIDHARWAPNSCNRQTWKVLPIVSREDKEFLSTFYASKHNHFWTAAPVVLIVLLDSNVYGDLDRHYIYLDAGAFIQNILLAAHAIDLGVCWVGFHAFDAYGNSICTKEKKDSFCEYFNLPSNYIPVSLLPAGYYDLNPKATMRKSCKDILLNRK